MSPEAAPSDPLIGRILAQYEIVARLGGGGMGVVYKARDTKLGRFVALKFLPPQWSYDEGAKQRFIREAQAASATHHRSICTIHDIEESDDGRLFIVMAFYEGETLKQRLERGPLPVAEAIEIAVDVADGLAKAHAQGVVHRDIKPGNIILTDEGAKILDFGLAKFADALQLTAPGSTVGTVNYMSPEQTRGEEADAQSDVWSWGVVLFEMLAGVVPFRGGYPEAAFYAIRNEPLPSLRALRPEVPEALELIVSRALEKGRADRTKSAREPARALRWLQGRTVPVDLQTEAVTVPARLLPSSGRSRTRVPRWVFGVAVAGLLAAGAAYWRMSRPVVRARIAVAAVANHTGVAGLDQYRLALTESLIDELSESPNVEVVPYLRLVEMLSPFMQAPGDLSGSEAVQAVASTAGVPLVAVPVLAYRDRDASWLMEVQIRNADTGTAVASFETPAVNSTLSQQTAFRLVAAAADQIQAHFKTVLGGRAYTARPAATRFAVPDAARAFAEGLTAYESLEYAAAFDALKTSSGLDPQHAMTEAWRSRVATLLGRRNDAIDAANRARQLADNGASPGETAFIDAVRAESQGDLTGAESAYRRLVSLSGGETWARTEWADFLKRRQDRNTEAIEAYHDLLRLDPGFVRPHVELCQLYTRVDDHPLAEREGRTALEKARAAGMKGGEGQALLCLAEEQRKQGGAKLADARRNVEQARALFESLSARYNLARASNYTGLVEYSSGRLAEAAEGFRDAATRLAEVGNRALEGVALMNLGAISFRLGQPTLALDSFRRGHDVFLQTGDERRAAEADINVSGVQIEHGVDLAAALRTSSTARATLERLGYVEFQLLAMLNEAEAYRYAGQLPRARTLLRSAFEIARSRGLTDSMDGLSLALAQADLQANDYLAARTALEQIADEKRGNELDARIALGTVLTRLGEFDRARAVLDQALADVETNQRPGLRPLVHAALGQLAHDAGDAPSARRALDAALASWTDPLPNAAAVEARCDRGAAMARAGQRAAARLELEAGQRDAERVGRLAVVARCRVRQAEAAWMAGQPGAALQALGAVPDDTPDSLLGGEQRAEVEHWRGVALDATREAAAGQHLTRARSLLDALQTPLSPEQRNRYVSRVEIRTILGGAPR